MTCLALLRLGVLFQIVVVLFLDFCRIDADLAAKRVRREYDILDLHLLGYLESGLVGFVVRRHGGIVDLDVLRIRAGRNRRRGDFALLVEQTQIAQDVALGNDISGGDRFLERRQRQRLAHVVHELRRRFGWILRGEELLVSLL